MQFANQAESGVYKKSTGQVYSEGERAAALKSGKDLNFGILYCNLHSAPDFLNYPEKKLDTDPVF